MIDHPVRVGRAERRLAVSACHLGPNGRLRQGLAGRVLLTKSVATTSPPARWILRKTEQLAPRVTLYSGIQAQRGGRTMAEPHHAGTTHHLRVLFEAGSVVGLSDRELLDGFASGRDEAAFTALVDRHGPMVQRVCGEVMGNFHDAQDAFQAKFLVLARHASSIRRRDSLASWLYGVALRVSASARSAAARRRVHERNRAALRADQVVEEETCGEIFGPLLHAELGRLPERFRAAVVLCFMEGRTYGEAAQVLRCPVGTIKSRLATARERLRRRLGRLAPASLPGSMRSEGADGSFAVPLPLPASLVEATVAAAVGRATAAAAARLASCALCSMFMSKLKLILLFSLAIGSLAGMALPLALGRVENWGPPVRSPESDQARARADGPQESGAASEVRTVFFRVIDQSTKQPLSGVKLKVLIDFKVVREHVTDETGRLVIPLPGGKFDYAIVTARKEGLVPMRVYLRRSNAPDLEIPRTYALAMGGGTSIGGIVRDESGLPIEGVSAKIAEMSPADGAREVFDVNAVSSRTDALGRWHIDVIPASMDLAQLQLSFSHPDFLSVFDSSRFQANSTPSNCAAAAP
jgi:RNA polymerase sigma factor (sigma-70 family)